MLDLIIFLVILNVLFGGGRRRRAYRRMYRPMTPFMYPLVPPMAGFHRGSFGRQYFPMGGGFGRIGGSRGSSVGRRF